MAKYFLTHKAVEDLAGIWDYTYEAWSESQADKYYELLVSSFTAIVKNPGIGKNYDAIERAVYGFHVGRHIVIYRILDAGNIEILRILHQRMDLKSRLDE